MVNVSPLTPSVAKKVRASFPSTAPPPTTPGDRVIICSYASLDEKELARFKPTLIYLDEHNHIVRIKDHIPVQAA